MDLKDFDLSCQTPVEVFDLKSGDAGDVRSSFVPYTTSFNTDLVRYIFGIYESYGIPTSSELIDKIIAFPDSTTCMETVSTPADAGIPGDTRAVSPDGDGNSPRPDAGKGDGGQGQTANGTTTVGGNSSGCSCTVGTRKGSGVGLYAGLLCAGMVAWRRTRRRASGTKTPTA